MSLIYLALTNTYEGVAGGTSNRMLTPDSLLFKSYDDLRNNAPQLLFEIMLSRPEVDPNNFVEYLSPAMIKTVKSMRGTIKTVMYINREKTKNKMRVVIILKRFMGDTVSIWNADSVFNSNENSDNIIGLMIAKLIMKTRIGKLHKLYLGYTPIDFKPYDTWDVKVVSPLEMDIQKHSELFLINQTLKGSDNLLPGDKVDV